MPVRVPVPLFAATRNCTQSVPDPLVAPVNVIHEAEEDALHEQLAPVRTSA